MRPFNQDFRRKWSIYRYDYYGYNNQPYILLTSLTYHCQILILTGSLTKLFKGITFLFSAKTRRIQRGCGPNYQRLCTTSATSSPKLTDIYRSFGRFYLRKIFSLLSWYVLRLVIMSYLTFISSHPQSIATNFRGWSGTFLTLNFTLNVSFKSHNYILALHSNVFSSNTKCDCRHSRRMDTSWWSTTNR